jgi:hypothetical protein
MGIWTVKRAGTKKSKTTPKFLLIKDADEEVEADAEASPVEAPVEAELPADEALDEDWPEREDIRNGLVDQVSSRFGISQDVAIRAVNDMLRLS